MSTPESIKPHSNDYKNNAWKDYTYEELAQWVSLLTKRASHRDNEEKKKKDLYDAKNYLEMMNEKFKEDTLNL